MVTASRGAAAQGEVPITCSSGVGHTHGTERPRTRNRVGWGSIQSGTRGKPDLCNRYRGTCSGCEQKRRILGRSSSKRAASQALRALKHKK